MDLALYLRVLWRFRILVAVGLMVATALGVLSYLKVDFSGGSVDISYRQSEEWASTATVFVTQEGFPLGRSVFDEVLPVSPREGDENATSSYVPRYADPSRFASYALLYARLATSDMLERQMTREAPLRGEIAASVGTDPRNPGIALPLVEITGVAALPADARATAGRAMRALVSYVEREQRANRIPESKRIILRALNEPSEPTLVAGRSATKPVFIFLAVMVAICALAFLLENVRPRVRAVPSGDGNVALRPESRRTA